MHSAEPRRPWHSVRIRVPREHRSLLARPPLQDVDELLLANQRRVESLRTSIQGRSLADLRVWARQQILQLAREYTGFLRGEELVDDPRCLAADHQLIVGGHQPSLYHPGVWAKNFAVHHVVSAAPQRLGLNLVVDNDVCGGTRVRVPTGTRENPEFEAVPFDQDHHSRPWEDVQLADVERFLRFPGELRSRMARWGIRPLVHDLWHPAEELVSRTQSLCDLLTALRHRLEVAWGNRNWEVRLSQVCRTDAFLWFASHLLAHAPRFRQVHNEILAEYRLVNRVRSQTHPVPELIEADGWTEVPFWMWTVGDRSRRRVMVRQSGREVQMSDGREVFCTLPLNAQMDACCAVEELRKLDARGIRFRTRALTTTLFSRAVLADLFCHGIGGAKYDEMTDRIFDRFFGIDAPGFLTISATVNLPLAESFPVSPLDEQRLVRQIRDLDFNSDRYLVPRSDDELTQLLSRKLQLVHEQHVARRAQDEGRPMPPDGYSRYRTLRDVNRKLARYTLDLREKLQTELHETREQLRCNRVLQDREYSFCLFPESLLRPFLTRLGEQPSVTGEVQ